MILSSSASKKTIVQDLPFLPISQIFEVMGDLVVSRFPDESSAYWTPLMERVTFAIYSLAENPDLICGDLLRRIATKLKEVANPDSEGIVASTPRKNLPFAFQENDDGGDGGGDKDGQG